jgi:acylphosphatase
MTKAVHAIISGRVQGVGYRNWTVITATKLGVEGWVRNRSDGTVETVFHGSAQQVDAMLEACRKGPMLARVDGIQTTAHDQPLEKPGFPYLPTL